MKYRRQGAKGKKRYFPRRANGRINQWNSWTWFRLVEMVDLSLCLWTYTEAIFRLFIFKIFAHFFNRVPLALKKREQDKFKFWFQNAF